MKETIVKETANKGIGLRSYVYGNPTEALRAYSSFSGELKSQMAEVYKQAFGGTPWFEKFKCGDCGEFSGVKCCPGCNGVNMGEAYPTGELINDTFPKMLSTFTPGVLATASENGKVIGFVTGGEITLGDLVEVKYGGNAQILESIVRETGMSPTDVAFYNNEFCVLPERQNQGIGTMLGSTQIREVLESRPVFITGRTINPSILSMRRKELTEAGYDFSAFVPNGDKYKVNDNPRFFYTGMRR